MKKKRKPKWLRKWEHQERKARDNWDPYVERNKVLRELGFTNYAEYLASPIWADIKSRRMKKGATCSCCPKKANLLHHDTYYRKLLLGDEASIQRDLYPLCHSCHRLVEFEGDRKRSWGEAIRKFRRMIFQFKNGMTKGQMIYKKRAEREMARQAKKEASEEPKSSTDLDAEMDMMLRLDYT